VHLDIRLRIYRVGETCELVSDLITQKIKEDNYQ
jgi:hypothetical protein